MNNTPTIAVITIFRFGDSAEIQRTLASVRAQSMRPNELILVCNNADEEERAHIEATYYPDCCVWDEDDGIYDAMNIGLANVDSDFVIFLNGGDAFIDDECIERLQAVAIERKCHAFRSIQKYEDVEYIRPRKERLTDLARAPAHQAFLSPVMPNKPIRFHQERYPIGADHVWMLENIQTFGVEVHEDLISKFELGGISNWPTFRTVKIRFLEFGTKRALIEVVKLILSRTFGARLYFKLNSSRKCELARGEGNAN